jgi:hypothetical protein
VGPATVASPGGSRAAIIAVVAVIAVLALVAMVAFVVLGNLP